jgi:hypothetical protein
MVEWLPPGAKVIRGAKMTSQNLLENAQTTRDEETEWALCVASYPDMEADEIAFEMPYRGRYINVSTVGNLRDMGFDVVPHYDPEGGYVHALLKLPVDPAVEPSEEEWEGIWNELRNCFEPRRENPAYGLGGERS